ncbi:MAG: hypothetical protein VW827_03570 [Alphaproteobacteria bacterium]
MTRDFGINESAKKYFDVISESDTPLQVCLSDKNNAKLTSLCKKLDQLYSLRSKLKEDFFKYLESDQYYYDIYQTIKCLGLATPSLKSNSVESTLSFLDSARPYNKFSREYKKKLSSFSKIDFEPIENNNIQLKKMRRFVENHLIHILVSDAYEAAWTLNDMHDFYNDETGITLPYRMTNDDEAAKTKVDDYLDESNKLKIFLKKKSNEKLEVYIKRIKKMFIDMPDDNMLQFTSQNIFKIDSIKHNLVFLPKNWFTEVNYLFRLKNRLETINFDKNFSKFFDFSTNEPKLAPALISALLDRIYFKKSLSIEAKYKEEIEKIEQEISTDCLYLKKKMNINYSINLCEKLIKDGFNLLNQAYGYINIYPNRGYLDIFHNEMIMNSYKGGEKFVPKFYVQRTKFYQEENLQHPIDINGDVLMHELDLITHDNLTLGHSSYLFNKLFVNTNTIHDAVTNDKFGDPNPANEDWKRSMNARFALSENLLDKFQNFIMKSDVLKIKQKNIDWIQLELINYLEDNQDIFIENTSKYKNFLAQSNQILLLRIKEILHDYEGYEKEIQKLRKKVYLYYKKITKNHTYFGELQILDLVRFEADITKENPKHKRFAFSQIALYEDPYNYDYRKKNAKDYEPIQSRMKKQNDLEPFSNHNISVLRDVLKKDQLLSEEDYKYLRSWHVSYSEMKRFHDRPKFLSSNRKKIFNVDDFFICEHHFLELDNKDLKDLLSQLFNYINIDQSIATVFQEQIEKRTKNDVFSRDHNLFSEFPQIKIKNINDYESAIWWLIYNFISTQKSHIYHSFNNSLKDIILRALLFIRGIYPYRSGSGMKDPYERIITELTKAISFYDSFSEQIYRDKISITASLLTNEIINSLRCIRDYIYTLKIANVYEIENGKNNNIVNKDIKKNDLQFISRSPQWRNEIPIDFDLAIKKYLKECNKRKKGENENFINKQVYDKKGKQELKTAKNNKSLIDRNSALKWLKERSGKYKLNELNVDYRLEEDIGFNNYGLYLMTGDTHIKFSD